MKAHLNSTAILALAIALSACGGGGSGSSSNRAPTPVSTPEPTPVPPITSFELTDPAPAAENRFGDELLILSNGNVVVSSYNDSSVVSNNGAIHLYNAHTQERISSIYGDTEDERLGLLKENFTALGNNNFVVLSAYAVVNGIVSAGSVRLFNGTTGAQIGSTISGDNTNDRVGRSGIKVLANNNYIIASGSESVNGKSKAGTVRLMNGNTGEQIGATLTGDSIGEKFGSYPIRELENGNFIIPSPLTDVGVTNDVGSVRLISGSTGLQVGTTLLGDIEQDLLGRGSIAVLANNNFVVNSPNDDEGGVVNAGSVRLMSGETGLQIGATLAGNNVNDDFGSFGVRALGNSNYVVSSPSDNVEGINNAGSVRLMNGSTGEQIGNALEGKMAHDEVGSRTTILSNNNYVVATSYADIAGISDAGSVQLMNGSTGAPIGTALTGDLANDILGSGGVAGLTNGHYVVTSPNDGISEVGGATNAGSVQLMNGSTGAPIGGNISEGRNSSITALANNNFVIIAQNEGGSADANIVRLISGADATPIGSPLTGGSYAITKLASNRYGITTIRSDEGGIVEAGSFQLFNGDTGIAVGNKIIGLTSQDLDQAKVLGSTTGDFYIFGASRWDNNGVVNSGLARLVTIP